MEYMGDKNYWDKKFSDRGDKLLEPEKSLVENVECLKKGSVLDIACGDGRNAMFFIRNDFKVTGVDFSHEALSRLQMFAERQGCEIDTKQVDLNLPDALKDIGIFDNIVINHYRLNKKLFEDIENHISDNGILFICGFGHKHKADDRIRAEDLIQPTDFEGIDKSFELVKYDESQEDRGFFVTYIFKKR